jgi:ribosomal protein S18 acetylase RimI-like enzyme
MISARQARLDDLPRLAALARLGSDELRPTRGGAVWAIRDARPEPVEATLMAAIDDPGMLVVVGEISGTVVGYGVTRVEELRDGSRLAVIDDIYVHPEARSVSVGEAMVNLIVPWSTKRGCRGIDGLALPGNRDTKNFFETFGFKARAIIVHRPIDENQLPDGELDDGSA